MIMFHAPVPTSTANSVAQWRAKVEVEHDAPFFECSECNIEKTFYIWALN